MDFSSIDPALLERFDRILLGVSWGGGAIVIAVCLKIGGPALAQIVAALRGGQSSK